jgi:site-specific DNA recombinase
MPRSVARVTGQESVLYLRVSTKAQVATDYDPEGISIPAQRAAATARAKELDSPVIKEFIDPGRSAKNIDTRPEFLAMIDYLRQHPTVKYVIVYALSRFARNRYDDAIMMVTLEKLGVTLISATERNLDDTPAGKAMHGMIAVMNQYRSDYDGEDIKYKMAQKAKAGGTLGQAKLGYLNVREQFEGREVRTISLDEQRAPLVRHAFELFATGTHTQETLLTALADLGLTMRPTRKLPERPVSATTIGSMLRDRYYTGYVLSERQWRPGRHPAIITEELFERVQRVLDAHSGSGVRKRHYHHYLKGTLWCKRCSHRLIVQRADGNGGTYFYYFCLGRRQGTCTLPYLRIDDIEQAVLAHYATVRLPEEFRARCRAKLDAALDEKHATTRHIRHRLTTRLTELDTQEDRYIEHLGNPAWPTAKLEAKITAIATERAIIQSKLSTMNTNIENGRQSFYHALDYLSDPQALYQELSTTGRKLLNTLIFKRLLVDTDDHRVHVAADQLHEPFHAPVTTHRRHQRYWRCTTSAPATPPHPQPPTVTKDALNNQDTPDWDLLTSTDLLTLGLLDQGSNKAAMVGDTGIEPVTSSV